MHFNAKFNYLVISQIFTCATNKQDHKKLYVTEKLCKFIGLSSSWK